jgi:alpha-beta hydrolase superfamily lysophospholipase
MTTVQVRFWLRVALYGGFLLVGLPLAFSEVLIRAHRLGPIPPARAPYEEAPLVAEGLRLRAWLARGLPERPAVVIAHGLGDSLDSYLEHARIFRERGSTVLLLDMRGHGGSEGRYTTLGCRERFDVLAAVAELRRLGLARSGVVLEGHSMGAVAVLLAAPETKDLRGVIVEAPYDSYRRSIAHHAHLLYKLPEWLPLIPLTIAVAEWRAGFDADDGDAVAAAGRFQAPLLAIADGADPRMPEAVVRRVFAAHRGPGRLWLAGGVDHVGAILRSDYRAEIGSFLDENGL